MGLKIDPKARGYQIRTMEGAKTTLCLLCSLRKMAAVKTDEDWRDVIPMFTETLDEHYAREHPDARAARDEQARLFAVVMYRDVMGDDEE